MKNFIFKSSERTPDLQKIVSSLTMLLAEQRAQRVDLEGITRMVIKINRFIVDDKLQAQVDDFYGRPDSNPDSVENTQES